MERIPDSQPSGKGAQCLDTPVLLVGLDSRTATVQDGAEVSREVSRARSSLAPGTCLGETTACLCSPGNLCTSACGSFANSHAPLGTAQMALGGVAGQPAGSRTRWPTAQRQATAAHATARVTQPGQGDITLGKFFSERSRVLYWFLVAGITKYYKFGGLKTTDLFSYGSRSQKSEMGFPGAQVGVWSGCVPSGSSDGHRFPAGGPLSRSRLTLTSASVVTSQTSCLRFALSRSLVASPVPLGVQDVAPPRSPFRHEG